MAVEPLQTLSTLSGFANFQYETLNPSSTKPSIRLAVLQPGTRESNIRIKLAHKAYADRPKYEALSYTWGRPDVVKYIELNDTKVVIRENLWFALVHFRNSTEERTLWIDTICINQADLKERSEQVQFMAYIYSRAEKVLVWLGVIDVADGVLDKLEFQKRPSIRSFKSIYPSDSMLNILELEELRTVLSLQPYWCRVWIVQEVCSAITLEIHWGLNIKPEPDANFVSLFKPWEEFFSRITTYEHSTNAATKISLQRNGRHSEAFLLASLMEACQESICEEPRDKVYAFLGIAHDCEDGQFPVDYSKSLFELYEDVIHFHSKYGANSSTVVHFSQLVQRLFGGSKAMEQDLKRNLNIRLDPWLTSYHPNKIRVEGKCGIISLVGPSYEEVIALPGATKKWKTAISTYKWEFNSPKYPYAQFLEQLRKTNENLMAMLYDLNPSNVSGMTIAQPLQFWDNTSALNEVKVNIMVASVVRAQHLSKTTILDSYSVENKFLGEDQPRLFSTLNGVVGLMPPNARPDDILVQFGKSDIALVLRRLVDFDITKCCDGYKFEAKAFIIGRALLAPLEIKQPQLEPFNVSRSESQLIESWARISMCMDLRLLQLLTREF